MRQDGAHSTDGDTGHTCAREASCVTQDDTTLDWPLPQQTWPSCKPLLKFMKSLCDNLRLLTHALHSMTRGVQCVWVRGCVVIPPLAVLPC
ncbi:hypothetical protein E2C01_018830 [Portunus trituberculatus]|uniref:Uncharacterized protein n=1 Tax=Portunus trituberculatus TaxID=210409 RepID=A0A5B7DXE8_PORTR|nr:hypothetical protein [Portunus trituberculatus]